MNAQRGWYPAPVTEPHLRCPGCDDGTSLRPWPPPSNSPYRDAPESPIQVQACETCAGVWVDRDTLGQLLESAAQAASPSSSETVRRKTMPVGLATSAVVYRRCPECEQAMLRKNFGTISGIVVDVCGRHGTFFDYGELPGVVDFVRSGGLSLAQKHAESESLRDAKQRFTHGLTTSPGMGPAWLEGDLQDPASDEFLRRVGVFVRNMFR